MNVDNVSEFLKDLRLEHGYSQEELAEKLFISRQAISNWEVGKTVPDYDTLIKLCDLYNLSVEEILRGKRIYNNKIYRFLTKVFSESNVKRKFVYMILWILFVLFMFYVLIFYFNTYNKIHFYKIMGEDYKSKYSCQNGILTLSNDTVLYKNCDLTGFDGELIKSIKYYYNNDGSERIVEHRESSSGYSSNDITNTILFDSYNTRNYFEYNKLEQIKDNFYVEVVTDKDIYNLKLVFVEYK